VDPGLWILGVVIALLSALNAIFWGHCVRELGDPRLELDFLLELVFNKWFVLAMGTAFVAALLSYAVLRQMGVLAGRFFLSLGAVATVLACTLVLGERPTLTEWIGILLIIAGALLIGRW